MSNAGFLLGNYDKYSDNYHRKNGACRYIDIHASSNNNIISMLGESFGQKLNLFGNSTELRLGRLRWHI